IAVTSITVGGTVIAVPGGGSATTPVTTLGVAGGTLLGTLTVGEDGSYSFVPEADYNTVDGPALPLITYTITDDGVSDDGTGTIIADPQTATAALTLTITPANDGPVIATLPPVQATFEDTDLVFSAGNGNAITVGDIDGDSLTVTLGLTHGTLTITAVGSGATIGGDGTDSVTITGSAAQINAALEGLTHTPLGDYNGPDTIAVSVDDGTAAAVAGSIAVNVDAVADVVDDAVTTAEDVAIAFNVLTGTNGASADNFTTIGAGPGLEAQLTGLGVPVNGGGVTFAADGTVTYTPAANFVGTDTFDYTIETPDGAGGVVTETGSITVTVTAVNDAPVQTVPATPGGVPIAATTTTEDGALVFNGANGNALTIADLDGPALSTTVSVVHGTLSVTDAATLGGGGATLAGNGTDSVTISGTVGEINAALEGLSYTPLGDFNTDGGTNETLVMTTDDGSGLPNATMSDAVAIGVTAVADATDDTLTTNEDTPITFNVLTGAANPMDTASADTFASTGGANPGGDATIVSFTQPANGTVTQGANGVFTYTPDGDFNTAPVGGVPTPDETFTYTVQTPDGNGGFVTETATVTISVTPVNDQPQAEDDSYTLTEDQGAPLVGNLIADATGGAADSDVDGDPLTVSGFTIAGEAGPFVVG
ncbi:MAG: Ig-like domain-containing protein, partial [Pseudomonadota bacterium]